jgi:hypothetical protein
MVGGAVAGRVETSGWHGTHGSLVNRLPAGAFGK